MDSDYKEDGAIMCEILAETDLYEMNTEVRDLIEWNRMDMYIGIDESE